MIRIRSLLCLVAAAMLLAACQKAADKGNEAAPAGSASSSSSESVDPQLAGVADAVPAPPELGDFKLVSLLLGKSLDTDGIVQTDVENFAPKDKIYASVLSTGAHQGLRLQAKWLAPDGSTVAETEQPLVPIGPTATSFSIANPAGWPAGEYQLRIAINGSPMQIRKFQVQ